MDCRDIILSEDYADFIIGFNSTVEQFKEKNKDNCPVPIGIRYGSIYKPLTEIEPLGSAVYSYQEIPKLYGIMDTVSVEATGALKLQTFPSLELKGCNIMVGVIDDGIDVSHEAFRFSNGKTRFLEIWDQTNQNFETPKTQKYGSLLSKDRIDDELNLETSEVLSNLAKDGEHGTFTLGVAAGTNNIQRSFLSPAPNADLVFVKLKQAKQYLRDYYLINKDAKAYQENDILNAIVYLVNVSIRYQRPIIICIPLGTSQGAHSGLSTMGDILNDSGGRSGVGIVVANGNEGNTRHHYSGKILENNQFEDVEIRVGEEVDGFSVELWGESPDIFSVSITSPTGENIKKIQPQLSGNSDYSFLFEQTTLSVNYRIVERRSGGELIQLRFTKPTPGIWTIRVYGENIVLGEYNMWLPIREFIGNDTYFLKPDPFVTLTNPSDAFIPISVGAYSADTGGIFLESSRGYPTDQTVKPTLVAPGVNVYGPAADNRYVTKSGTSAATALAAGVCAQIMEWGVVRGNRFNLNTTQLKNYLVRGAFRRSSITYPNREWGFGSIDAFNSIDVLRG